MSASPQLAGRRIIFHDAYLSEWQEAQSVPQPAAWLLSAARCRAVPALEGETEMDPV